MRFFEKVEKRINQINSLLCVGIDPRSNELKKSGDITNDLITFGERIIQETSEYAMAFKPNIAFFEIHGWKGIKALEEIIEYIPSEIPVILDVKRGDIASTADAYAKAYFEELGVDAVTINPYLGSDAISPFSKYENKGIFLLCKTSNKGASEIQDLRIIDENGDRKTIYEKVGELANKMNRHNNIGLVIGATQVNAIKFMRNKFPEVWFLTPGIGAQGGNLEELIRKGVRKDRMGIIVPISRAISQSEKTAESAKRFRDNINRYLEKYYE